MPRKNTTGIDPKRVREVMTLRGVSRWPAHRWLKAQERPLARLSCFAIRSRQAVWPSYCHGAWHLYGHSHGRIKELPNVPRCDVGVDVWDFAPVPWDAIKQKLSVRKRQFSGDVTGLDANMAENIRSNRDIVRALVDGYAGAPTVTNKQQFVTYLPWSTRHEHHI
jgi:hypothetical protein